MDRLIASNTVPVGSGDTAPATGTPGQATSGNPATNTPATALPAYAWNAIQEEMIAILSASGIAPDRNNNAQIVAAIRRIGQNTVVLADTGVANAYTAVNATPLVAGTWVDGVVQAVKIAHANTGASTYAPDGLAPIPIYGLGLQPLQGGELALNGTAVLMHATIAGVNSGNPICVLTECFGGAQQVAAATQSQHAIPAAQAAGLVGAARNLAMSVSAASASATLTADEIIVETALGGIRYCLPAFNQTINLATTGAGGMDTGTAPTSGFVALYAIYNPTTKAAALLATNATSAVAPAIYGGANMPVGFTASALVSVWATNASRQLVVASQIDREVFVVPQTAFQTSTQQSSSTPLSISALVPPNAKSVSGNLILGSSSASASLSAQIAANAGSFGGQQLTGFTGLANLAVTVPFRQVPLLISQTIYYACVVNVGTASFTISLTSYTL